VPHKQRSKPQASNTQASGYQPAWATGSAGNLKAFPILPGITSLTILVDNDANGAGQDAAKQCATRWAEAGRDVTKLTPHEPGDFNDVLMQREQVRQ